MIQDIAPHKLFNPYLPEAKAAETDRVVIVRDDRLLIKSGMTVEYPTLREFLGEGFSVEKMTYLAENRLTYLFSLDEERYFLYGVEDGDDPKIREEIDTLMDPSLVFRSLKDMRNYRMGPMEAMLVSYTARHLSDWYLDNVYCGRCGFKTEHSPRERARICPMCGNTIYPRIMPAVIVGVLNKDRILVTKYNRGFAHNALIAGFTEIGETLEETVEREVMEEAGLKVKNIRYYKSQPWGVAGDLLAGFYCEVDGDDTIVRDENELKSALWTTREDMVLQPDSFSLTNEMMQMFKEGKI